MRAFNTRQRNRRLQTSGRAIFTSVRDGLLRRKKRDYSKEAHPINNGVAKNPGSVRSFNVAQSFEPFFDYGSFFSGVLRALPAFGVCTAGGPDGVLRDKGRLEKILQHATIVNRGSPEKDFPATCAP
jgi:hypothetical protein